LNTSRHQISIVFTALAVMTLLLFCNPVLQAGNLSKGEPSNGASKQTTPPDQYCAQTGGVVETRTAWYGTNGSSPLRLAGIQDFCQYTASDGSRIHTLVSTLYTPQPTLAALAYYAKVQPGSCNGNPASCYCTLLGGSDQFGGTTGAGGGWVKKGTIDFVLEACIFPDMSSIDSWGLFYHSAGIIRGIDLGTVLKYPDPYTKSK
jgi:putative hemolysin